jgi:hypothetical protein
MQEMTASKLPFRSPSLDSDLESAKSANRVSALQSSGGRFDMGLSAPLIRRGLTIHVTSCPLDIAALTTARPIVPVAPTMRTRFNDADAMGDTLVMSAYKHLFYSPVERPVQAADALQTGLCLRRAVSGSAGKYRGKIARCDLYGKVMNMMDVSGLNRIAK